MTTIEIVLSVLILVAATRMLPRGGGGRHFVLPLVFAGLSFASIRRTSFDPSLSWLDAGIVTSFIVGFHVKGKVESETGTEDES